VQLYPYSPRIIYDVWYRVGWSPDCSLELGVCCVRNNWLCDSERVSRRASLLIAHSFLGQCNCIHTRLASYTMHGIERGRSPEHGLDVGLCYVSNVLVCDTVRVSCRASLHISHSFLGRCSCIHTRLPSYTMHGIERGGLQSMAWM
jgi:hypothetical protein